MDKIQGVNQFLNKLVNFYSASFKGENDKETWKDDVLEAVYNPKIDYDKLFKLLIKNSYNDNFIPSVAQINEAAKSCYLPGEKRKAIFNIRALNLKTREPCSRWASDKAITLEQAQKYLDKYEPGIYRVLEVY